MEKALVMQHFAFSDISAVYEVKTMKFEEINGLSHSIKEKIKRLGFTDPTEIQDKSIPLIIKGKDVIGESATGSGKTLAFGCGMQNLIPKKGIQALVLTPTRELAEQVKDMLQKLTDLRITSIYGGVSMNPQIHALQHTEIVVATPGRLLDHMQRGNIDLTKVSLLILDEADRMLDMGFIEDVEHIIRHCPKQRQTLFFSATIEQKIADLSKRYMKDPIKITAERQVDPKKLKQLYYDVHRSMKLSVLVHLLQHEDSDLVMVFCNTRRNVDFVVKNLKVNGIKATAIHGGFSQNKRSKTLQMFNDAKITVMVCTDVAARGLDIPDVSHVYNYETPADPKDYVHRIGRTARAGERGKVINLISDFDHENFGRMQRDYSFNVRKEKKPFVKKIIARRDIERRGFRENGHRGNDRGSFRGNSFRGRGSNQRGNNRSNGNRNNSRSRDEGKIPVHLQL